MSFWQSRDNFELALNTIPNGVFIVDKASVIQFWNDHMEQLTGFTRDEALGQPCAILACEGRDADWSDTCPLLSGEVTKVEAFECHIKRKDGQRIPILRDAASITDTTGAILGIIQSLTDLRPTRRLESELANLRLVKLHADSEGMVGKSAIMNTVYEQIGFAANSEATVLIQGETGTGKERAVEAIHKQSHRSAGPLIKVNCSALPEGLLESELFGHVKGAFTGAIRDKTGRFELADGGTIFLDEIGDISPLIQLKLLRVLQERTIERLGDNQVRSVNVRVVAATHRDLKQLVADEIFREDLYYRLCVFPIRIPALRERKVDIPMLVDHFIRRFNKQTGKEIRGLTHEANHALMDACWPGNVRELENALEHAFVTCVSDRIDLIDLPVDIRNPQARSVDCVRRSMGTAQPAVSATPHHRRTANTAEELVDVLKEFKWNKTAVADALGINRVTVWRKMKQWNISSEGR